MNRRFKTGTAASLLIVSLLAGCKDGKDPKGDGTPPPRPVAGAKSSTPAPNANLPGQAQTKVAVQEVGKQEVTIDQTFTAQTLAAKQVEVRSRIEGNLNSFSFREGSQVSEGQVLFQIDPRPLLANVAAAQAQVEIARANLNFARTKVNLKKAQADQAKAQTDLNYQQKEVDRYKPLVDRAIIPRQLFDQTVAQRDAAKAQLDAAKAETENTAIRDASGIQTAQAQLEASLAALDSAQINLDYTTVYAPITGTIGQLNVYPGNLVQPGGEPLVTLSSTNPIYVEFSISESDYLKLATKVEETGKKQGNRVFQLLLADGKPYKHLGKFNMIDRAVDATTGTIRVRLEYANPMNLLRPGQFVNVRLNKAEVPDALLIHQRAVMELQSSKYVYVVDKDNKVEQREITVGERYQGSYVVTKGLKQGERVIVDGMAKVKPGMTVSTEEAKS